MKKLSTFIAIALIIFPKNCFSEDSPCSTDSECEFFYQKALDVADQIKAQPLECFRVSDDWACCLDKQGDLQCLPGDENEF